LAGLYEKARRPELAARAYQRLHDDFAKVTLRGGQTGEALVLEAKQNAALKPFFGNWPSGAVEVKESETSGLAPRTSMPIAVAHYGGAAPRGLKVSYDTSGQGISVRSDTGQLITSAGIRNDRGTVNRPMFFAGNNPATAKVNGHLVVVHMGAEIVAVDGLRPDRGAESLLWRQETGEDPNVGAPLRATPRGSRNPLVGNRQMNVEAARASYSLGPVTSGGVCFQRGRQLVCVDALTGASLWERSSSPQAEIPLQADIFGDDELLFVSDARLDSKSEELLVLSAIDGSLLAKRKIEPAERRWATHGRHVLTWEDKNSTVNLRLYDAWNDRELWSRPLAKGSKGCLIDGDEVAILEPAGQFTVVSLESGKVRFAVPLEAEASLAWIQVFRSSSQYLLLASQASGPAATGGLSALQAYGGTQQQGMNGRVYAFSRNTGKLQWPAPALVKQHWLPPDQPSESPLLFFVANRQANNKLTTAVLVLDRRSGREVYANELPGIASTADIVVDPVKQNASLVLIGNGNRAVSFQFTEKPLPPQPPARSGETANNSAGRKPAAGGLGAAIDNLSRNGVFVPDAEAPAGANPVRPAP
jgi:outer membrane protein assembly factor BamB